MRILLDQGTPLPLRYSIAGHSIQTVNERDWTNLSDYELLEAAANEGFEVLITPDKQLPLHHDLTPHRIAVVVLNSSRWKLIRMVLGDVESAIVRTTPGSYLVVDVPEPDERWNS